MLQLKNIELQGFKSFPDKTVIRFGSGITAIVGPNGSGKSNIVDAVRWVMGETSSKQLRGQKMEDVVFDGTSLRKPLGYAEVSLVLDNSDKTLPIEFEEVVLTRRYYRSGESEYFINRTPARLKDIQDLLRDTGLGKAGYSIIGQGSITEIIAAKSTDRRFIFEEAAGIAKFRYKKEESERRLNRTEENISRLSDILSELAARIPELERQSAKARRYLDLRQEKKGLELMLWTDELKSLEENLKKNRSLYMFCEEDMSRLENELRRNETQTTAEISRKEKLTAEIEDLRITERTVRERIQERKAEILVKENDIEHAGKDIERLTQNISRIENDAKHSEESALDCDRQIDCLNESINFLEKEQLRVREESDVVYTEIRKIAEKTTETEKQITEIKELITYLQIRFQSLEQETENREKMIQGRKKEIEDARERLQALLASEKTAVRNIENLKEKLNENNNIKNGYEAKFKSKNMLFEADKEKLERFRTNISDRKNRLQILRGMEKHYEGFQNSIRLVMEEAKKGVLRGIEGTVSDILDVSREYTTAIETALGGSLQNIVTSDEKSGKNGISFLKSRNAGRATFLPLDTIRPIRLDIKTISGEPGFIGVASDLVECEDKYRKIADFLLGKTLVAEDMNTAVAIARKNRYSFRIVTLDGQLVNVGGSLTGGSAQRGLGVLSRKNEIEELDIECKRFLDEEAAATLKLKKIGDELSEISALISGTEAETRICEEQLIKEQSDADHIKTYISNISEQEAAINKDIELFSETNEKTLHEKEAVKTRINESREKLEIFEKAETDLRVKAEELNVVVAGKAEKIHTLQLDRLEKEKDLETALQRKKEISDSALRTSEILEGYRREISAVEKLVSEYRDVISRDIEENKKADADIRAASELVSVKAEERNECEKKITALRDEERNLFAAREKTVREAEKSKMILENAEAERDSIITRIWDEYELTLSEAEKERSEEDTEIARKKVARIKTEIKTLGDVNPSSIDEYISVKSRHDDLSAQINDMEKARKQLEGIISDLEKQMTEIFKEKFAVINKEFEKAFRQLFDGGAAKLELDDCSDILNSGVEIYVAPPGKIIKNLTALSGGEQALTAIALYFALLTVHPAPFCLLDEIEAALDDVNVVRYAEYLARHDKTQFIVITHRRGTMEAAGMLYGVTMKEKGISKILAIDVSEIKKHV